MENGFYIEEIYGNQGKELQEVQRLLEAAGLSYDPLREYTVLVREESTSEPAGTGALSGHLLRCVAVAEQYRGQGISGMIMGKLFEYMYEHGRMQFGGFTKPKNLGIFSHEGLNPVRSTDHIIFLENRKRFEKTLEEIRVESEEYSFPEAVHAFEADHSFYNKDAEEIPDYFIQDKEKSPEYRQEISDLVHAELLSAYLGGDEETKRMYRLCAKALREEVNTTPKPGLVDLHDNGSHQDMNVLTFYQSTYAVAPYLTAMFQAGRRYSKEDIFPVIRRIGIDAEKEMLERTEHVNTHKGMIFSMGIILACAGYLYEQTGRYVPEEILSFASEISKPIMEQDFLRMDQKEPESHGEKLYRKYGIRGVRGQAMDGFPELKEALACGRREYPDRNTRNLHILLSVMKNLDDTNILSRGTMEDMKYVRQASGELLEKGITMQALQGMNEEFVRRNISPGGAADMLAAGILLLDLEQISEQ